MKLIDEMKKHLLIPAYPTKELLMFFRKQRKRLDVNAEIQITEVFDSGEAFGGLICAIAGKCKSKEVIIVSLTHLRIGQDHILSDKIIAYQTQRVEMLNRI